MHLRLFGSEAKTRNQQRLHALERVLLVRDATQRTCSGCLGASIEQRTAACPSLPGYIPKTHCSYSVTMAYYSVSLDTNYLAGFQTEKNVNVSAIL